MDWKNRSFGWRSRYRNENGGVFPVAHFSNGKMPAGRGGFDLAAVRARQVATGNRYVGETGQNAEETAKKLCAAVVQRS